MQWKGNAPNLLPCVTGTQGRKSPNSPFDITRVPCHIATSRWVDIVKPPACIQTTHSQRFGLANPYSWCEAQGRQRFLDRKRGMISLCKVFQSAANQTLTEHSAFYFLYRNKWQNSQDLQRESAAQSPYVMHYY